MKTLNMPHLHILLRNLVVKGSLSLCLALTCALGFVPATITAQAASLQVDPLVFVVSDVTSQGGQCTLTYTTQNPTTNATITQKLPCAPGSIIKASLIPRSQAIATHEAYVLPPTENADLAAREQMMGQLQQLVDAKRQALRQASVANMVVPNIACGSSTTASQEFFPGGDDIIGYIQYFKSSDCSSAFFDTSSIEILSLPNSAEWWQYDQYDGYKYWHDCIYELQQGYTYSYPVDQSDRIGLTFEHRIVIPGSPSQVCSSVPAMYWDDIPVK